MPRQPPSGGAWWAVASAMALLAASRWLYSPTVQYLVVCISATALALLAIPWLRGAQRRWAIGWGALSVVVVILGIAAQAELHQVNSDWDHYRTDIAARGMRELGSELNAALVNLRTTAQKALQIDSNSRDAFRALRPLVVGDGERGVVIFRGDSAIVWAGRMRSAPDSMRDSIGVDASPFYLTLYATARRGDQRSVATLLLDAVPPADRLADALASRIAKRTDLAGFTFAPASDSTPDPPTLRFAPNASGRPLLEVRPAPLVREEIALRVMEQTRLKVGAVLTAALVCFILGVWRGVRALRWRFAALAVAIGCAALVPLNQYSNLTRLFDAGLYYTPLGGPLTASAGALGIASAIILLALLTTLRRRGQRVSRWVAVLVVLLVAGVGPFLLRELATGVNTPPYGVSASLWLIWEVPLFLAAVSVMLAGAGAGGFVIGRHRGLPPAVAPLLAMAAAALGPVVWQAPGQWPWWYTLLWIGAIAALALSRQTRLVIMTAATVAAMGATILVWSRTARGRVALAEHDLSGLATVDNNELALLEHFGETLHDVGPAPVTRAALLQRFATSDLAAAGYPAALAAWPTDSVAAASLQTADFAVSTRDLAPLVHDARQAGKPLIRSLPANPATELALAAPGSSGSVTTVVVTPRTRLVSNDPFLRFFGIEPDPDAEVPYALQLGVPLPSDTASGHGEWRRDGSYLHGDFRIRTGTGGARAHVDVELRSLDALVQRGSLILLLDIGIVGALWLLSVLADGGVGRWLRARQRTWGRSYRLRLTLALFAFFVIPAVAFAIWSYRQLASDASHSRDLLVRETLHAVSIPIPAGAGGSITSSSSALDSAHIWVEREADRLDNPLLLYRDGELFAASDPLYQVLAPVGRFLRPDVQTVLGGRDEEMTTAEERVGGVGSSTALFGFRAVERPGLQGVVIAAPARADESSLDRRRRDLGILVLFTTAVGALAALWLSGIAARQLARPIGNLREAALAIAQGGGERVAPLDEEPTAEFTPVFSAFRRMAADLHASRSALEEAQRRTAAVLRNVASGVVAVDTDGRIALANPRASALLGAPLRTGTPFEGAVPPEVAALVLAFVRGTSEEEEFEVEVEQRQLRGYLTRLARGGAVVTLDDVTELARAQRVIAWGEMARQIAHEIKNPLTPIRLGVQHLLRARADRRVDFDAVLRQNVARILTEIDRLDEIARSFSRYGSAPSESARAVPTDVGAVVREVMALETMGAGEGADRDVQWHLEIPDDGDGERDPGQSLYAWARDEELHEVLLNVLENARLANASEVRVHVERERENGGHGPGRVVIRVHDDGHGIPETVLPRIFEPHFSTRTSGSGLGLAVSRRIIDAWGGEISATSAPGEGTTVTILLRAASSEPS